MKKILLQKERDDVTSSHKIAQIQNDKISIVKTDRPVSVSPHTLSFSTTVPIISSNATPSQQFASQPVFASRPRSPGSSSDLKQLYRKKDADDHVARSSSIGSGVFSGFPILPEAMNSASTHLSSGLMNVNQVHVPMAGTVTMHTNSGSDHSSSGLLNGSQVQARTTGAVTMQLQNRPGYLDGVPVVANERDRSATAAHSGVPYFIDKSFMHQVHVPSSLSWMGNMSKFMHPSFTSSQQNKVEPMMDRSHSTPCDDPLARYPGSVAGSSCASNTAEESTGSIRDEDDSRPEFYDNTSDDFMHPETSSYQGDSSTRDVESPVSLIGFKSPSSVKSVRGRGQNRRSSNVGPSGTGRSSVKLSVEGCSGGRSIIRCPICSKLFNNSSALAKHKLTHSDERKYTCTMCSKSFKRQDHLNGHMMTHSSKKPFECKFVGCTKSYCDARSLRRHLENHHQDFINTSDHLQNLGTDELSNPGDRSQFGVNNDLIENDNKHRSSISPPDTKQIWTTGYNPLNEPKPVKCHICDRGFKNIAALNGHMRLHGGYVRKENEESGSEANEFVDVSYQVDGAGHFRSITPQLKNQSTERQGSMLSGEQNLMSKSHSIFKDEQSIRNDTFDQSSFSALHYRNKGRMPDLLRNTNEEVAFLKQVERSGMMQTDALMTGKNKSRPVDETKFSTFLGDTGYMNIKKEYPHEGYLTNEATTSKSVAHSYNPGKMGPWSENSYGVKFGREEENLEDHIGRRFTIEDQRNYINASRSREATERKSSGFPERLEYINHLQNNRFSQVTASSSMQMIDEALLGRRHEETRLVVTQPSKIQHFQGYGGQLPRVSSFEGLHGYYNEVNDGQSFIPQAVQTNRFASPKPSERTMVLADKQSSLANHAMKLENTMDQLQMEAFVSRNKNGMVRSFEPVSYDNNKEKKLKSAGLVSHTEYMMTGKSVIFAGDGESYKTKSSRTLSSDENNLSSPDADKGDSLYRRRVKNLMLKHGVDLEKVADVQTALNSPRLGFQFAIPSAGQNLQDDKSTASSIGVEEILNIDGCQKQVQSDVKAVYCESGSPRQTFPKTAPSNASTKPSEITKASCNGCSAQACGQLASGCCMQVGVVQQSSSCPYGSFSMPCVGNHMRASMPFVMESSSCETEHGRHPGNDLSAVGIGKPLESGHQAQHEAISAEHGSRSCQGVQNASIRCRSSLYQHAHPKVMSHPTTPSCTDSGFLITRHLSFCSKSQCSTPSCHGANVCPCVGVGSDVGVLECSHGQRTPVVLHRPQIMTFAEQRVVVGCCQPTFAVTPLACDHRQLGVVPPRTPCMAHTPCTPRDLHIHHREVCDRRGESCTPHCQRSCRALLTPASAITKQPCHFQFPPCAAAPCETILRRSPCSPHASCVTSCTPCTSPGHLGHQCSSTPHFNHQHSNDRGHARQTCDDDVFDAVLSCDRDRERLMKLVDLEVEERLRLRRQSEVEETQKLPISKSTRTSRPEHISTPIETDSTPVEPDSTVSSEFIDRKSVSENETESSDCEMETVNHVVHTGRTEFDFSLPRTMDTSGTRKRKQLEYFLSGEKVICMQRTESEVWTGNKDNNDKFDAKKHLAKQPDVESYSTFNKPVSLVTSITYRPWMGFESSNETAHHNLPGVQRADAQNCGDQNVPVANPRLLNSLSTDEQSSKLSKHRPQPLVIQQNLDRDYSLGIHSMLRSPCLNRGTSAVPYTPPPMLSATRAGSGLFCTLNDASSATLVRQESNIQSETKRIDHHTPVITDTKPHINVGAQFQAQLPSCFGDRFTPVKEDERATLVWHPAIAKKLGKVTVSDYEQYSCSAAILGNGTNREYAFHLLHQCHGNIKKAMKLLLDQEPKMPSKSTLQSYYYEDCTKWKSTEIESFRKAILNCDKDFSQISSQVGTKTRAECVQFYYVWKKLNVEDCQRLRGLRRRRQLRSAAKNFA